MLSLQKNTQTLVTSFCLWYLISLLMIFASPSMFLLFIEWCVENYFPDLPILCYSYAKSNSIRKTESILLFFSFRIAENFSFGLEFFLILSMCHFLQVSISKRLKIKSPVYLVITLCKEISSFQKQRFGYNETRKSIHFISNYWKFSFSNKL